MDKTMQSAVITEGNYVDRAESVILELKNKKDKKGKTVQMVTTSKIRNLLAMTADIYNDVIAQSDEKLTDDQKSRIEYLKIRIIYESGREERVKDLVEESGMRKMIEAIGDEKKKFLLFSKYMEALVAFHKFYGGKDQ